MGSSNSTSIQHYVNDSVSIKTAVTSSIEVEANTSTANYETNNNKITVGDRAVCCKGFTGADLLACFSSYDVPGSYPAALKCGKRGLQISQSGALQIKVSKAVTTASNATLIANVMNKLNNKVSDLVKQNNNSGILSNIFGESNDTSVTTKITNSLRSDMEVHLSQKIQANLRSQSGQTNHNTLTLCSGEITGDGCKISQTFSFGLYVSNVLGAVANTAANNKDAQKLVNATKSNVSEKNTNWLSSLIESLTKMEKIIILGIMAAVVIAIVFGFVLMVRGHSDHIQGSDYSKGQDYSIYPNMGNPDMGNFGRSISAPQPRVYYQ